MFARGEFNDAFRRALGEEVDRADRYLIEGDKLVDLLGDELRLDVALFRRRRSRDFAGHSRRGLQRLGEPPDALARAKLSLVARQWWRTRWRTRPETAR